MGTNKFTTLTQDHSDLIRRDPITKEWLVNDEVFQELEDARVYKSKLSGTTHKPLVTNSACYKGCDDLQPEQVVFERFRNAGGRKS